MPQFVAAITITQHEEEALGARVTEFSHKRRGYGPGSLSTRRFVVQGPDGRSSAKTKKEPLPPSSAPPALGFLELLSAGSSWVMIRAKQGGSYLSSTHQIRWANVLE